MNANTTTLERVTLNSRRHASTIIPRKDVRSTTHGDVDEIQDLLDDLNALRYVLEQNTSYEKGCRLLFGWIDPPHSDSSRDAFQKLSKEMDILEAHLVRSRKAMVAAIIAREQQQELTTLSRIGFALEPTLLSVVGMMLYSSMA